MAVAPRCADSRQCPRTHSGSLWNTGGIGTPCAVVLQLMIAESAVAGVIRPDLGLGWLFEPVVVEFVAPYQRSRGDIGRESLLVDAAGGNSWSGGDGFDRQICRHQEWRLVDLRGSSGGGVVYGVVNGGARRG